MARVPLTQDELKSHLAEQMQFLRASAESFDKGFDGEAKRLAATMRILLHDTAKSHSLLGQMGQLNQDSVDTAFDFNPDNLLTHSALIALGGTQGRDYTAMLDNIPPPNRGRKLAFPDWWTKPVFVDSSRRVLSRKDLVLTTANQDGGSHVDPAIDEVFSDLKRRNSLGWYADTNGVERPLEGAERAALRQIAHEVMRTLDPGMPFQDGMRV